MNRTVFDRFCRCLRLTTRGGWSYVLLIPWFVPLICYLLTEHAYWRSGHTLVGGRAFIGFLTTLAFLPHDWAADAIVRTYPKLRQTVLRAGIMILVFVGLPAWFMTIYTWVFIRFRLVNLRLMADAVLSVYGFDFMAILLLVGINETSYSLSRWQKHQVNKGKLKKDIRAKYQLLARPEPIIQPGPTSFTVILPLLQTALINP